jgi:autotransporter-associated beta strand protein
MNIGTGTQAEAFIRTNLNRSSPQNAVMSEAGNRVAALDTGHTIAAGEVFGFSYWWRDASGWNDGADRMGFTFYTTLDDTVSGAVETSREFLSELSTANSAYELAEGTHTASAGEDGKRLFISFRGVDGNGASNGFARVDDISVARGTTGGAGGGIATIDWAAGGAWRDADTGLSDTLLDIDSFAGAVLEFPVSDGFSYIANNSMKRATGEDFMLNKMVLSGTAAAAGQNATLTGNTLMFTRSLTGDSPVIENNALGEGFAYTISMPVIPYHELVIGGDGTAPLTIDGAISNFDALHVGAINKTGNSTVVLAGSHPYSGSTTVGAGTFALADATLSDSAVVVVHAGSTLVGRGTIARDLQLFGTLQIDLDAGDRIDVLGGIETVGATLALSGTPTNGQVIGSYGLLDGDFAEVTGLPAGFGLEMAQGGNEIAIVATAGDAYATWIEGTPSVTGSDAEFEADANGDGVTNGVAFFLGAPDALANATSFLPTVLALPDEAVLRFTRTEFAAGLDFKVRYSTDLVNWDAAVDGQDGVDITILGAGFDWVVVTFPAALAPDGELYCQLEVTR